MSSNVTSQQKNYTLDPELPSTNLIKYESFTMWLLGASGHESDILVFPLPVSAKSSNEFDNNR